MMPLVGVIAKAIGPAEIDMATRGVTPPDLGGGRIGARNVPRGYENFPGDPNVQRFKPASKLYHERMSGGADVPAHALEREEAGRPPIAHPASHEETLRVESEGGDEEAHQIRRNRLLQSAARGGAGIHAAMRRDPDPDVGPAPWFNQPAGGIGTLTGEKHYGSKTSELPGTVELPPHERRNLLAPGEGEGGEDVLDPLPSRQVGVRGRNPLQQLRGGGNLQRPRNPFEIADEPEGAGHRRG